MAAMKTLPTTLALPVAAFACLASDIESVRHVD